MPLGSTQTQTYFGHNKDRYKKTHSPRSQGQHSNLDIPHTRDMDRPTFYYENIVYHYLANENL